MWLFALMYVCFLLNHCAAESIGWLTPIALALGYTPDISAFLQFSFYEPVYYSIDGSFPGTKEARGRFVGIAETVGDAMTYLILTDDTQKVIYRSVVRPCSSEPNAQIRDRVLSVTSSCFRHSETATSKNLYHCEHIVHSCNTRASSLTARTKAISSKYGTLDITKLTNSMLS